MTAVEQLQENLTISFGIDRMRLLFNEFEKAKEMEKQQMFTALIKGADVHGAYDIELEFKEYYNETFKNTNK